MAAPKRRAARAGYIDTDWGLSHVPDLYVPDHSTRLRVGFLHDRFGKDEPQPDPIELIDLRGIWPMPRKHIPVR